MLRCMTAGDARPAATVVILITRPRSTLKWAVGLVSTVVSNTGGGAIRIECFDLQHRVNSPFRLCAMGGLMFACGLPGWAIVLWEFNFIGGNRDSGINDVAREPRGSRDGPHGVVDVGLL